MATVNDIRVELRTCQICGAVITPQTAELHYTWHREHRPPAASAAEPEAA